VLKVAEAFSNETDFTVWSDLSANLGGLSILYQTTDFNDNFKAYTRKLFTPVMGLVGWEPKADEGR